MNLSPFRGEPCYRVRKNLQEAEGEGSKSKSKRRKKKGNSPKHRFSTLEPGSSRRSTGIQCESSSPFGQMELLLSSWQTTIRFTVVHASHSQGGSAAQRSAALPGRPRYGKPGFDRVFRHYAVQLLSFLLHLLATSITSHQRD